MPGSWFCGFDELGESAGAMSVGIHLVSPKSEGLFHRAIMESNPAAFQFQAKEAQEITFATTLVRY